MNVQIKLSVLGKKESRYYTHLGLHNYTKYGYTDTCIKSKDSVKHRI